MELESGYESEVADVLAYALIGNGKLERDNVIRALEAHGECILAVADRIADAIETLAQTIEKTFGPRA